VPASHLFICFSSHDEATARQVVEFLEADGLKCWISLRDVPGGHNYQEAIVQALEDAQGIVFLFSEFSAKSQEIRKELSIGGSVNAPVFPLRLTPIAPTGALRYELATRQWIDIFPDQRRALIALAATIKKAINAPPPAAGDAPPLAAAMPARTSRAPIVAPGSSQFEAIRALLARHVGPIAKVLVEKAAAETDTADDFCNRLAMRVQATADRAAFLQAVRAQLSIKS
jgi:TIR domain